MPTVVGVRLRFSKTLWFDPAGSTPSVGELVVLETERGTEIGTVVQPVHEVEADSLTAALKPLVRVADERDRAHLDELAVKEREALTEFRRLATEHKLDMKPVDVEYLFGGDKIVFYFSADERVDFRDLVRELATLFKARIDMRQVGVRDEARRVGGVGHCGQQLCCARFGGEFQPVSIRMAKEQDLPLNPLKISGLCGRLMCCLRYEYDAYRDFKQRAPKKGALIETPNGGAKVTELNTPRETVRIRLEDGSSLTVPLAKMECAKGTGCPCAVGREAIDSLTGGRALAQLVTEASESQAALGPEAQETGGRRRRRRKPGGGGSGQQASAAQTKEPATDARGRRTKRTKQAASQTAQAEKGATAKADEGQRSRRRRRRGTGGGGASEGPAAS